MNGARWQRIGATAADAERNVGVMGILAFTIGIILYVSPPDYPREAASWGVGLWSEPSGWWSEITWILVFCAAVTSVLLFRSWLNRLKPLVGLKINVYFGALMVFLSWYVISVAYMVYYMTTWPGWFEYFFLDTTGTLHGLFYIATVHITMISAIYGLALIARVVEVAASRIQEQGGS